MVTLHNYMLYHSVWYVSFPTYLVSLDRFYLKIESLSLHAKNRTSGLRSSIVLSHITVYHISLIFLTFFFCLVRMAQLVKAPTKYSTFEWHKSNNKNYSSAETERASAERLQSESKRLTDETDEITRFTQEDVNKKLAQRLRELNFWKDEVRCLWYYSRRLLDPRPLFIFASASPRPRLSA